MAVRITLACDTRSSRPSRRKKPGRKPSSRRKRNTPLPPPEAPLLPPEERGDLWGVVLASAAAGHGDSFADFVREGWPVAVGIALPYVRWNRDDAEEVANSAFLKIHDHLQDYDPLRSAGAWVKSIVVRTAIDKARWNAVRHWVSLEQADVPEPAVEADVGREIEEREMHIMAEKAIDALGTKTDRTIVRLFCHGCTMAQIARRVRLSPSTAWRRCLRSLQELRRIAGTSLGA